MNERAERILAAVDLLAPAFERSGLDELELAVGDLQVRLARPSARLAVTGAAVAGLDAAASAESSATAAAAEAAAGHRVTAPLTGVWYAAPSPGARPYVTEGSEVAAGQVVGLIEAMKLFNEIKADASGTITRILVESGTLVKRTQPLMEIDPT